MSSATQPQPAAPDTSLEALFQSLVRHWKEERGPSSSTTELAMCPSYQRIIGLGPAVVPLLLRELERAPDHWFWALKAVTGADPVSAESRGKVREMARLWIEWDASTDTSGDMTLEQYFPNLAPTGYTITSPATFVYNCIAWAAGVTDDWWWPDPMGVSAWPASARREETVAAFEEAFQSLGYVPGADDRLESGFEKVALYAMAGAPKHAARQRPNGRWSSKLGELEDVEHTLDGLNGAWYGCVVSILKRPRAGA